jgi:hypothetical protein
MPFLTCYTGILMLADGVKIKVCEEKTKPNFNGKQNKV